MYRPLHFQMYCDIKKYPVVSVRGTKCMVVFYTDFGWVRGYPLKDERDAHKGLDLLFQQCGVPAVIQNIIIL